MRAAIVAVLNTYHKKWIAQATPLFMSLVNISWQLGTSTGTLLTLVCPRRGILLLLQAADQYSCPYLAECLNIICCVSYTSRWT